MYPVCFPANTGHSPKAVSMLAHRLRRWPNIETALGEWPVFAGLLDMVIPIYRSQTLPVKWSDQTHLLDHPVITQHSKTRWVEPW